MEIRFIWIQQYRGIIEKLNINFNHTGDHQFNYANNELVLLENHLSPLKFGTRIKGITAIAGKNGSGKTSICEVILNAAATYVNGGWGWNFPFEGIVCYGKKIFYSKDLVIGNLDKLVEKGYEIQAFEESPFEKLPFDWRQEFHKGSFVYYSNVLDWRSNINLTNLTNISTQYLLNTDYRTSTTINPNYRERRRRDGAPDVLNCHYDNQGYRNVKFYLHFADTIPCAKPTMFALKSTYSDLNKFLNYKQIFEYDNYSRFEGLEREILESIQGYEGPIQPGDPLIKTNKIQAKAGMVNLYRFNLLMGVAVSDRQLPDFDRAVGFSLGLTDDYGLFAKADDVKKLIEAHELLVSLGDIGDEFSAYTLRDDYPDLRWKIGIIDHLWIPNHKQTRDALKTFLTLEETILRADEPYTKRISDYSLHPWPSTGENSYYMLFSRLYDTINRFDIGIDQREDLVLFIDEGEVGFHPAWKKKYLKWIIDFLNGEHNQYNFQIIITTHSPYILSDLSSEHTILLNRDNGNKTEILPVDSYRTFGANIHELLADAFFLTDGPIGEFAKQKIQGVIDSLNAWRRLKTNLPANQLFAVEKAEKDECRDIIGVIGDVIVRKKLLEMYLEIFDDEGIVDQEILFLEDRLKQLRERKIK